MAELIDSRAERVANLFALGFDGPTIAERLQMSHEWVVNLLSSDVMQARIGELLTKGEAHDDGAQIYGSDQAGFEIDSMLPDALQALRDILRSPHTPAVTKLKAAEMVMGHNDVMNSRKQTEGQSALHTYVLPDQLVDIMRQLPGMGHHDHQRQQLEATLDVMPERGDRG